MKKDWTSFLSAFILILFCRLPLFSLENNKIEHTIKVGYMDYSGFIDKHSDGSYSGYGADYLAEISKYTNFKYEFEFGEWSSLLEKLKNKEIDLLCTAQYTPERAKIFDYSNFPIGYTQGLLYGPNNTTINFEDFTMFNNKKIGILENSAMYNLFKHYSEQNNFIFNSIEYYSENKMIDDLLNNKIDAMCSEHLANHKGLTLLASFGADAYYIISYKNSPYMNEINYALQEIKKDVDYESSLFHKYYDSSSAATTLQFTTSENEFIKNSKTLKVGFHANRVPFSQYNPKTGKITGISVDLINEIARKTNLKFEYYPLGVTQYTEDSIRNKTFDLICGIQKENFTTNPTVQSTNEFLESAIVPAGKIGKNYNLSQNLTVAIPSNFQALKRHLEIDHPTLKIIGYKTNRDCLDAVLNDEADIFIQNTHILSRLLQEPKYSNITVLPIEIMTEHTAIALPRSEIQLCNILNKAISNIDKATISSFLIKHTFATPYKYTFKDFIYHFKPQLSIIFISILSILSLLSIIASVKQQTSQRLSIANSNLEKAIQKAETANKSKSRFLAQMSHEIRTPMNAIIGFTNIAKMEIDKTENIKDYLEKIESSSKLLLGIINDILDMSVIERGKLKIDKSSFNFKKMLTDLTTIFYQQAKIKNVDFKVHLNGMTEETLIGDELRLNQILMNLLSNAIKFTPSCGIIKLQVIQTSHSHEKVQLRFSVSDTGCGISDDLKARLFNPFEQESASTAKKHGGSGLGLSITKNITELMGGSISVKSTLGEGSTFTVDIPFETPKDSVSHNESSFSKIRTLVVDDDLETCEYCSLLLDRLGVRHEYVTNGEAALEALGKAEDNNDPFKLCLIDWKMPDMDGKQVTQKIRETFGSDTIIIIVFAYDLNELESSGLTIGVNYIVPKPLFQSTLFNALMRISESSTEITPHTTKETFNFEGKRVLIAEDVALNMEVARKLLSMVNIQVVCAENGKQALDFFEKSELNYYDCILMDINMPIMNGYESTIAIRKLNRADAKTIPIFAMTANAFTEDITAVMNAGMNGHIAKPIETNILYKTLENAFKESEED